MNEREAYLRSLSPEMAAKVQTRHLAESVREEREMRENFVGGALWLVAKFPSEDEPGTFDTEKIDAYVAAIGRGERGRHPRFCKGVHLLHRREDRLVTARQKCAVPVCPATARRTVLGERYCFACGASVEQAAYMGSLPAKSAEHVLYRHTFPTSPPEGVTLPEPLATIAAPRSTGRGRR